LKALFSTAALNGVPELLKAGQEMFEKWTNGDKSAIAPDLRSAVFSIAIKYGGVKEVRPF
jgi:aminopeptidase 2